MKVTKVVPFCEMDVHKKVPIPVHLKVTYHDLRSMYKGDLWRFLQDSICLPGR